MKKKLLIISIVLFSFNFLHAMNKILPDQNATIEEEILTSRKSDSSDQGESLVLDMDKVKAVVLIESLFQNFPKYMTNQDTDCLKNYLIDNQDEVNALSRMVKNNDRITRSMRSNPLLGNISDLLEEKEVPELLKKILRRAKKNQHYINVQNMIEKQDEWINKLDGFATKDDVNDASYTPVSKKVKILAGTSIVVGYILSTFGPSLINIVSNIALKYSGNSPSNQNNASLSGSLKFYNKTD